MAATLMIFPTPTLLSIIKITTQKMNTNLITIMNGRGKQTSEATASERVFRIESNTFSQGGGTMFVGVCQRIEVEVVLTLLARLLALRFKCHLPHEGNSHCQLQFLLL
jgi:hypothetical protein